MNDFDDPLVQPAREELAKLRQVQQRVSDELFGREPTGFTREALQKQLEDVTKKASALDESIKRFERNRRFEL